MTRRVCPGTPTESCGRVTSLAGGRCGIHRKAADRRRHNPFYSSRAWQRLSARLVAAHVARFGWVCPGDPPEHPAHPSRRLSADHRLAMIEGGARLDPANLRVLCLSWNSTLGARTINARRRAVA
jgi:hypothetical protein